MGCACSTPATDETDALPAHVAGSSVSNNSQKGQASRSAEEGNGSGAENPTGSKTAAVTSSGSEKSEPGAGPSRPAGRHMTGPPPEPPKEVPNLKRITSLRQNGYASNNSGSGMNPAGGSGAPINANSRTNTTEEETAAVDGHRAMSMSTVTASAGAPDGAGAGAAAVAYSKEGHILSVGPRSGIAAGAGGPAVPTGAGALVSPKVGNAPARNLQRSAESEGIAAGWPSWLASVAGEAIRGWVPRRADSFEKLDKIGQGTYSSVYKARDLESNELVALKKVRFDNLEPESVRFMAREIEVLRRLNHPNVIRLLGIVTSRASCSIYLVFEYMEHDLAGLAASPGITFTEAQVKCYMQQLLSGLHHCHSHHVLHRDIKGSNLLLNNNGILKIADFGLATFFKPNQNIALTSRVVTLWYRPPELLLGATHYAEGVDLWSSGCILAELFAGKPIMPGRTEVEQLHKIFKLCGSPSEDYWKKSKLPHATIFKPSQPYKRSLRDMFKDFPDTGLDLVDVLLSIEPEKRNSAQAALNHDFFTTSPLPCDPSSLPDYPPSKELDAKMRDEESRRHKAAGSKGGKPGENNRDGNRQKTGTDNNASTSGKSGTESGKVTAAQAGGVGGGGGGVGQASGHHATTGSTGAAGKYGSLSQIPLDIPSSNFGKLSVEENGNMKNNDRQRSNTQTSSAVPVVQHG